MIRTSYDPIADALAVHFLPDSADDLAELFGSQTGDTVDKFARCRWHPGPAGLPILELATGGPRDAPDRHRALRATVDWSLGLLDEPDRRRFAALGVFAGGLDAVAAVQPADAKLVVRLLDSSLNTVHVVSTQTGATAALNFTVAPGTYAIQVFLASDGPRQASYSLSVMYP